MDMPKLLIPGDQEAEKAVERRMRSRALVNIVCRNPPGTPARWRAIRSLYIGIYPEGRPEHAYCVEQAAIERQAHKEQHNETGATRATRGIAYEDKKANGHVATFKTSIWPEGLKEMLCRFDPQILGINSNRRQNRKLWRAVERTFPEYMVVNQYALSDAVYDKPRDRKAA